MRVHTDYLWFNTKQHQEFVRITDDVARIVAASGVHEGMVLVSAMHITASAYVNDWEDGLIADFQAWLEKLAPSGKNYHHHHTGESNGDAHLKRLLSLIPCWEINQCPESSRATCKAYPSREAPCWEVTDKSWQSKCRECLQCEVYRRSQDVGELVRMIAEYTPSGAPCHGDH